MHVRNRLEKAIALETRPYNQGSRLTAYELLHDKIPFMLITDSMAAAAMRTFGVDAVLVGMLRFLSRSYQIVVDNFALYKEDEKS